MSITSVTDQSFQSVVLESNIPVVVDFWAEWCGPCKMVAPILEEVAAELKGSVLITKLNVDDNLEIPTKFGIRNIPTLLLFQNGEVKDLMVGAHSKTKLLAWIQEHTA